MNQVIVQRDLAFTYSNSSVFGTTEFRITPGVGDEAPDFPLVNVKTKEKLQLHDFRGKIVLLEYWSTGCGPCQPAMSKLQELFEAHKAAWKDRVEIVPLSTDKTLAPVTKHLAARGWDTMPQYWAAREKGEYFSDAVQIYVVHAIPHAILIDSDGKIAWRGHPMFAKDGEDLSTRISSLISP